MRGEARASNVYGGGRRGGRGRGPGLVLVLLLWRLLLQLVVLWWGEALLGGNRGGTGGHNNLHLAWCEGLAKPDPLWAPHGVNEAESNVGVE